MAIVINLNDKSFDYLNALSDVQEYIIEQKARGASAENIIDVLEQLGFAADEKFSKLIDDYHRRMNGD